MKVRRELDREMRRGVEEVRRKDWWGLLMRNRRRLGDLSRRRGHDRGGQYLIVVSVPCVGVIRLGVVVEIGVVGGVKLVVGVFALDLRILLRSSCFGNGAFG
jgi:hypothetical protein